MTENLPAQFLGTVERLATNPDVDPEKIRAFLDMQERIIDKQAEQAFNADMVKVQSEIKAVVHNRTNDQTRSKYADLEAIIKELKPIWSQCFALSFYEGEAQREDHIRTCVDVMHNMGHTKTRFVELPLDTVGLKGSANKTKIHGTGSSISYARRYLTCMVFNIPTSDDDDGNSAGQPLECISIDQQTEISDMLNSIYGDQTMKWFEWIGKKSGRVITNVSEIPVTSYKTAITALNDAKKNR